MESVEASNNFKNLSAQFQGMPQTINEIQRLVNIVATLNQAVCENDVHIGNIKQVITEQDERIELLTQSCNQKEKSIQELQISTIQLNYLLKKTRTSVAWKLSRPLRIWRKIWQRFVRKQLIEIIPLSQIKINGDTWQSTGNNPQFLLMTEDGWHGLSGWYWLKIATISDQPLGAKIYFDVGEGFEPTHAISFLLTGDGPQQIPLYVPQNCRAIRIDPCDQPAIFKLFALEMTMPKEAPGLAEEFRAQSGVYERLGGRRGNAASLASAIGVHPHDETEYCWCAEGVDPWFEIKDIRQRLRPGWYMIELHIRSDVEYGNAKFYFDYGGGYNESSSLLLPFRSGQTVKRLCNLKRIPRNIRLDPLDSAGKFTIELVNFTPVMAMFAHNRMLRRLRNCDAKYNDLALRHIWKDLRARAKIESTNAKDLLLFRYNKTFKKFIPLASYTEWIAKYETPEFLDLATIKNVQQKFRYQPTISVVMPTYNTAEILLQRAIESVLEQSYPNWELCIADDASSEPHVRLLLEKYVRHDLRIKLKFREKNGHISAASNSALNLATGEYVAFLDHDDELAVHALHFVVEALNQHPEAQIIYSDEDKIDEDGNRSGPHFKSDWNPDMSLSQNYICHLSVYHGDLLRRIGGFRMGVEGSQDYDLLLRCLPYVKPCEIVHIPKVLYHWRMLEGSTALASEEKSYTLDAGIKSLQDFFHSQGQDDVQVEAGLGPNTYRVRYPMPQPEPLVSLLIPTRDMLMVLEPCLRSILDKTTFQNYEIIILDNESVEPATLEYLERIQGEDARVRVLPYHHPFNYSAINNYGVQHAKGDVVGLINNDIEVISPGWLTEMVSHAIRPEIGCVGAKLYYKDETIQHAGVILGLRGVAGHSHKCYLREESGYFQRLKILQNLSAVTAACLVVRKSIYQQVGGLEEEGLTVAFNDVDFCLKVREAGYRNLWTPYAELYHHESKSRGEEDTPEKVARFNEETEFIKNKWGQKLRHDPYYNQNLTLNNEDFSIG